MDLTLGGNWGVVDPALRISVSSELVSKSERSWGNPGLWSTILCSVIQSSIDFDPVVTSAWRLLAVRWFGSRYMFSLGSSHCTTCSDLFIGFRGGISLWNRLFVRGCCVDLISRSDGWYQRRAGWSFDAMRRRRITSPDKRTTFFLDPRPKPRYIWVYCTW